MALGLVHEKWCEDGSNSILCEDSGKFDYPIYYSDIKYIASRHYGYENSKKVLTATNAACNFIKSPYPELYTRRSDTFELFKKYEKQYNALGYKVTITRNYDPFMFMYSYIHHKNMMVFDYNVARYNMIVGSELAEEIKHCDILFKENYKRDAQIIYQNRSPIYSEKITTSGPFTTYKPNTLTPAPMTPQPSTISDTVSVESNESIDIDEGSGSGAHSIVSETTTTPKTTSTTTSIQSDGTNEDKSDYDYDYGYSDSNVKKNITHIEGSGDDRLDSDDEDDHISVAGDENDGDQQTTTTVAKIEDDFDNAQSHIDDATPNPIIITHQNNQTDQHKSNSTNGQVVPDSQVIGDDKHYYASHHEKRK